MAGFEKLLRELSPAEMRDAARELLDRLYPAPAGQGTRARAGENGETDRSTGRAGGNDEGYENSGTRREKNRGEDSLPGWQEGHGEEMYPEPGARGGEYENLTMDQGEPGPVEYEPLLMPKSRSGLYATEAAGAEEGRPGGSRGGEEGPDRAESARELSEFFRRDSRRYDREFQRY